MLCDVHITKASVFGTQEVEISTFNQKKAAVQAQRAQSERDQLTKSTAGKRR